jgi:ribosome-associated protein
MDYLTIQLDQFLKVVNAVGSGGEAKHRIQNGEVEVNGQVETRRGRKLVDGDVVKFAGEEFKVSKGQEA